MMTAPTRPRRRGAALLVALWLLLGLAPAAWAPHAMARSVRPAPSDPNASLVFFPDNGPVGTQVSFEIRVQPAAPTPYVVGATTTPPDQGGCDRITPVPGLQPVTVPAGTYTTFAWPDLLGPGRYWLCAQPSTPPPGDGGGGTTPPGPLAHSAAPFTVTGQTPPTLTFAVPATGFAPGDTVQVTLANWLASGPYAAPQLALKGGAFSDATPLSPSAETGPDAAGTYQFTIHLPSALPTGDYTIEASAVGLLVESPPLRVVSPTPTAAPRAADPGPPGASGQAASQGLPVAALAAAGVLVLLLSVGALLLNRVRRVQRQPARDSRGRQTRP